MYANINTDEYVDKETSVIVTLISINSYSQYKSKFIKKNNMAW